MHWWFGGLVRLEFQSGWPEERQQWEVELSDENGFSDQPVYKDRKWCAHAPLAATSSLAQFYNRPKSRLSGDLRVRASPQSAPDMAETWLLHAELLPRFTGTWGQPFFHSIARAAPVQCAWLAACFQQVFSSATVSFSNLGRCTLAGTGETTLVDLTFETRFFDPLDGASLPPQDSEKISEAATANDDVCLTLEYFGHIDVRLSRTFGIPLKSTFS